MAEQGQCLPSHGLLDERELAHLGLAERIAEPGGFGVDAPAAPGLAQQAAELGEGEAGAGLGGRGGGEEGSGLGAQDAAVGAGEGGQQAGVVLAQVGAKFVVRGGAFPDGVLLGPGQDGDDLGEFAVGRQGPVHRPVGPQDVGQDDRVAVVGFAARDGVPVPVAGYRQRVDRVHRPPGRAQAGGQQPARGLDGHRDRVAGGIAAAGQQVQQGGKAGRVVADPAAGQQRAARTDDRDVVMIGRVESFV